MRYLSVLFLMLFAASCNYGHEDDMLIRFMVTSPSPVTITCYSDQLGEATFTSPGGDWAYEIPIEPPMVYRMLVTTGVNQTITTAIVIQEEYDGIYPLTGLVTKAITATDPYEAFSQTPTRSQIENTINDLRRRQ